MQGVNEAHIKPLADAIYADKVRRAQALTEGERIDTAIELFEGALGMMRDGLRAQFPGADEAELESTLRKRLRRLRQVDEFGLYRKASA
jgi:Rv0078B-related antitoxin